MAKPQTASGAKHNPRSKRKKHGIRPTLAAGRADAIVLPSPGTLKGEELNSPLILPRPTDLQPVDSEATSRDAIPDEGPGAWTDGKTDVLPFTPPQG